MITHTSREFDRSCRRCQDDNENLLSAASHTCKRGFEEKRNESTQKPSRSPRERINDALHEYAEAYAYFIIPAHIKRVEDVESVERMKAALEKIHDEFTNLEKSCRLVNSKKMEAVEKDLAAILGTPAASEICELIFKYLSKK